MSIECLVWTWGEAYETGRMSKPLFCT